MREQNNVSELLTKKIQKQKSKIPKIININKWFSVAAIEQKLNKKNRTFGKKHKLKIGTSVKEN